MRENFDVFNSIDDIYLVFTKKSKFSFYFILFGRLAVNQLTMLEAGGAENAKLKNFGKSEFYWYQHVPHDLRKCLPTLDVFVHK